jgi:ABC-type dipeptide/oligopeptide/nickel transport system ATPase component
MSYDYQTERPKLFTEDGLDTFLRVREAVKMLTAKAGACTISAAVGNSGCGDSWTMLAALDLMKERGEITIIQRDTSTQKWIIVPKA